MHRITKVIHFSYGHRLLNYKGKCRFLHGHNGKVEITLRSEILDERGMLMDFTDLKTKVKSWIDNNLDHRMILRKDDPAVPHLQELGEPLFLMDENPTAENIAKLIFNYIKKLGLPVEEVRLWETESSFATYSGND